MRTLASAVHLLRPWHASWSFCNANREIFRVDVEGGQLILLLPDRPSAGKVDLAVHTICGPEVPPHQMGMPARVRMRDGLQNKSKAALGDFTCTAVPALLLANPKQIEILSSSQTASIVA